MSVGSHGPPPSLSVTVQVDGNRVRVDVAGEVDIASVTRLGTALDGALSHHPAAVDTVTVDIAAVTFMDSSGISTLVQAHTAATRAGITLTVVNCPPIVRRVFTVTGVLERLTGETQP